MVFPLLLAFLAIPALALDLVTAGRSTHTICVAPEASPAEQRAALELQRFVEQMSGAKLPVATGDACPARDRVRIVSGAAPMVVEQYRIETRGRDLVISGGGLRGAMYGVYALLDKLGCRWFSADVSRIPSLPTISLGTLNEMGKPAFEYREVFFTEAWDKDWSARNRVNGQNHKLDDSTGGKIQYFPFVHSFYDMIPPAKYFAEHPEYFSEIDGKRRWERGQLCLTNPDVLRLGVERVREWIRQHPEATILSVSQNDWTGWCECDRCRRVEQEEGGAHIGPVLRYVNALAAEIEKTNPGKLIDTLAYWYTERPPAKVRPRANVRIRLCPIGACEAHAYEKCPYNALFVDLLKSWAKITNQLYIWHYNTNFSHYLLPFPDFDEFTADIPLYQRNGVVGVFLQGAYAQGGGGENAQLRSYLMARMLWDPAVSVEREINDFHAAYYGPAAATMRRYFELQHEQIRSSGRGKHFWIFVQPRVPYLSADFLDRASGLFDQAEREAAGDPAVARRVRKARLPIEYVKLRRAQQFEVRADQYAPDNIEALKTRFASFVAEARSFGIQQFREHQRIEQDEQLFAAATRPFRAVTLASGDLRAVVIPMLNARVIRFGRGASGNVLRIADSGSWRYPDLSGLWAEVRADYHAGTPYEFAWNEEVRLAGNSVSVEGRAPNGLVATRSITLTGDRLATVTTVRNESKAAIPVAIQARADYSPSDDLDGTGLALAYAPGQGVAVDRLLWIPRGETSGNQTFEGSQRPNGNWRAYHRAGAPGLVHEFDLAATPRTLMSWSLRGASLITLAAWSREETLAPGASLRYEAHYRVR